jgi:hypothetical protein
MTGSGTIDVTVRARSRRFCPHPCANGGWLKDALHGRIFSCGSDPQRSGLTSSIDHAILRHRLSDWVDCPGVLWIIDVILGSYPTGPAISSASFPGDDLFSRIRPRGLPLGNLTSQLWGNFYLDEMDHWMVETERQGAYLRYQGDLLRLTASVFAWYQFSREGNTEGLRRAWASHM